jgi:antitoxin component HigA of HigAB toxin-antitoxin module
MSKIYFRKEWENFINDTKYKIYFMSNEENWNINFEAVKKYIDENNKRPSTENKNNNIKSLGYWISDQQKYYKERKYNMANDNIYQQWTNFINDDKYKKYFISNEQEWLDNLNLVKKFMDKNNKRPSTKDNNTSNLGNWISNQQKNFLTKKYIMEHENIRMMWNEFINEPKYKQYFLSNEQIWYDNLNLVKKYIDDNHKKPSSDSKDIYIKKLGKWLSTQQQNYSKQINIMKNIDIYNQWMDFINDKKYKNYFIL